MSKKRLCVFLVALVAVSLIIIGGAVPATAKTLEIGAIYSLTGLGSELEIVIRNGALLCQDWINEKGGITVGGEKYKIKLIVEDQKGNVAAAVGAATKLVERDQVKFIIGQVVPDVVMAVASVTEPAKVLRSSNSVGIPVIATPKTPYTFRPAPVLGPIQVEANYDYLRDAYPHVKTVAIINPDEPGGHFFLSLSEKAAKERGFKVVAKEFHNPQEQQEFYPVWTKILAAKPDAVDTGAGFPIPSGLKFKQGRELGFKGPIFSPAPVELYIILDIAGKDLSTDYFNSSLDIRSRSKVPSKIKEIQKMWEAEFKSPFMFEGAQGWDALWALTQAIEAAQSLDPTDVMKAWEKMKSIETSYGNGHMGGLKTYGVNHIVVRPTSISRLKNGKVELIKWYKPEVP